MTVAESLRRFRSKYKLTQKNLAETLGIAVSAYQGYEYKIMPPAIAIIKIANAYNVSADYLLGLSDDPQRVDNSAKETDSDRELIEATISYHKTLQAILAKRGLNTATEFTD